MAGLTSCPSCNHDWIAGMVICPYCGHVQGTQLAPAEQLTLPPPVVREPGRETTESGVPPAPLSPALLIIGATNEPIPVGPGEVVLGRLSVDDRIGKALNPYNDVGRYHAALTVRGSRVEIQDLNSTYGTMVGDRRLPGRSVEHFDLPVWIRLASSCYVRVEPAQ